jgi:hypothetical protein
VIENNCEKYSILGSKILYSVYSILEGIAVTSLVISKGVTSNGTK